MSLITSASPSLSSSHMMARVHAVLPTGQAAPPSDASGALSSLSRFQQSFISSHTSRGHGRRQGASLRASKPLLQQVPVEALVQSRRRDGRKDDFATTLADSDDAAMHSLDSLRPHFASEAEENLALEARLHSIVEGNRHPDGSSGDVPKFWTLNWSSALEAVENVLSFAQGLQISLLPQPDSFSLEGEEDEEEPTGPPMASFLAPLIDSEQQRLSPPPSFPARSFTPPAPSQNLSSQRREALLSELETLELMLRPKCPWPRQGAPSPLLLLPEDLELDAEESTVIPSPAEPVVGPPCAWPRQEGKAPALASSSTALTPEVVHPRCAWPRVARTESPTASPALDLAYPRSAWPRGATKVPAETAYPRCAFPKAATSSVASAATSLVDLASVALVAAALGDAPRCAFPRRASVPAVQSAISAAGELSVAAPRCAWPRVKRSASSEDLSSSSFSTPRCAWPRSSGASSALSALPSTAAFITFSPEAAEGVPEAARCAWPRVGKKAPAVEVAEAPAARCAWPRKEAAAAACTRSDSAVDFGFAAASVLGAPGAAPVGVQMAPRCAWPRLSKAEPAAGSVSVAARCAWPRTATLAPATTPAPAPAPALAEQPEATTSSIPGPRCAWPRPGVPAPSTTQSLPQEYAVPGPRCAWPPASRVAAATVELNQPEPSVAEGPRCAWPKKAPAGSPAMVQAAKEEEQVLVQMGPRCPWPRVASTPQQAVPNVGPSGDAESEAAGSREDRDWELLPAVAREDAGHRRASHVAASALGGNTNSIALGPRCPWPRAAPAPRSSNDVLGSSS